MKKIHKAIGISALTILSGIVLGTFNTGNLNQPGETVAKAETVSKTDSEIKYPVLYENSNSDSKPFRSSGATTSAFLIRQKLALGDTNDYYASSTENTSLLGGAKTTELAYILRGNGDLTKVVQSDAAHQQDVYNQLLGFTRVSPNGDMLTLSYDTQTKTVTSATAYTKVGAAPTVTSLTDNKLTARDGTTLMANNEYDVNISAAADATQTTVTNKPIDSEFTVGPYTVTVRDLGAFTASHKAADGTTDVLTATFDSDVMTSAVDRTGSFFPDYVFDAKYSTASSTTPPAGGTTTSGGSPASETWTIHGHDGTTTTNETVTPTNFDGYAISSTGQRQPVAVDTSEVNFTKHGTYPVTLTAEGISKTVQLTISSPYLSGQTGLGQLIPGTTVREGQAVYAVKGIYLYSQPTFATSSRKIHYPKRARINRPMFVVTGYTRSKTGTVRYIVRDVNHTWKTDGKKGYITANTNFVQPVYYSSVPSSKTITVLATKGINTYRNVNLTGKAKHYKTGAHLRVKKIVKYHLTTRYILSNGQYLTTNKKLIIAGRY